MGVENRGTENDTPAISKKFCAPLLLSQKEQKKLANRDSINKLT